MKGILILLFFGISFCAISQTKIIAHKSHSGSKKHFSAIYKENKTQGANFGLPGDEPIAVLDTVHALNDSTTILKYRKTIVCVPYGTNYKKISAKNFEHKVDTLINNELVYKSNTAANIKKEPNFRYIIKLYFHNPISEIVFIGFKEE